MYNLMLSEIPILTPLFYHYESLEISPTEILNQFMFGESLLVALVMFQKVNEVLWGFPFNFNTNFTSCEIFRFESTSQKNTLNCMEALKCPRKSLCNFVSKLKSKEL